MRRIARVCAAVLALVALVSWVRHVPLARNGPHGTSSASLALRTPAELQAAELLGSVALSEWVPPPVIAAGTRCPAPNATRRVDCAALFASLSGSHNQGGSGDGSGSGSGSGSGLLDAAGLAALDRWRFDVAHEPSELTRFAADADAHGRPTSTARFPRVLFAIVASPATNLTALMGPQGPLEWTRFLPRGSRVVGFGNCTGCAVPLPLADVVVNIWLKVRLALSRAVLEFPQFEFVVKTDVDACVVPENLVALLGALGVNGFVDPMYLGDEYVGRGKPYYAQGGFYVLSRAAVVASGFFTRGECGAFFLFEDMKLGACMAESGVALTPVNSLIRGVFGAMPDRAAPDPDLFPPLRFGVRRLGAFIVSQHAFKQPSELRACQRLVRECSVVCSVPMEPHG